MNYFYYGDRARLDQSQDARISETLLKSKTLHVGDKMVVPRPRRLLQTVETAVQPDYLTGHFTATRGLFVWIVSAMTVTKVVEDCVYILSLIHI